MRHSLHFVFINCLSLGLEHGLESAIRSTQAMFAQNIDLLHNLTEKEIDGLSSSVPTIQMDLNPGTGLPLPAHHERFLAELTLLDVCMAAKCFSNQAVALKVINDGGVQVNHKKLPNPHAVLVFGVHILPNRITVLRVGKWPRRRRRDELDLRFRVGKKNFYMIRWADADMSLRSQVE